MTSYHVMQSEIDEARKLTDQIKRAADNLWELLLEAWNRKSYVPLGYKSWNAYVEGEFDFSRRRSYQLINQGIVTRQLRDAAGVNHGTQIDVSEREARDIAPLVGEVVEEVREQVAAGVPAQEAVRSAVESHRPPPMTRTRLYDASVSEEGDDGFNDDPVACVHEYVCRFCGELA